MPFIQDSFDDHLAAYRADLARSSEPAQHAIRALAELPIPADVDRAEIELFMDEYGGSPAFWIYFKGRNTRVDHADPSIFAGRSMELDLGLTGYCQIDEDAWSEHAFQNVVAQALVAWFRDQWLAVGAKFPIPIDLSVHDGIGGLKPVQLSPATQAVRHLRPI